MIITNTNKILNHFTKYKFYFVFIEKKEPYDIVIVDYQSRLDDGRVCYSIGCSNIELFRTMDEQGDKEKLFYGENEIQLL